MAQITAAAVVLDDDNDDVGKAGSARMPAQLELGIESIDPDAPLDPTGQVPVTQSIGFALGWDFAHHGLTPPALQLYASSPLRQGFQAGCATFGRRTLRANRLTQQWLLLRTYAGSCGRSFEGVQLTPNYLQQIEVGFCPITRLPLDAHTGSRTQAQIDRVRDDGGYAAGNLAVMSRAANLAKARHDWRSANELAHSVEAQSNKHRSAGLGAAEWQRLALLCSFVTELPHEQAAALPLLVLPPNRLRLFNPIQALQAMLTRQLATPGWSARLARIEALLPNDACKADFNRFVLALVPRVLVVTNLHREQEVRWALEDAWQQPLLQKRWIRFALHLSASQAEALLQRAAAKRLVNAVHVQQLSQPHATEGWALERGGFCEQSQSI